MKDILCLLLGLLENMTLQVVSWSLNYFHYLLLPRISTQAKSHVVELTGFPVTPSVFSICENPSFLIFFYCLQIFWFVIMMLFTVYREILTCISKYLKMCTRPRPHRLAGGHVRGFSSRWRSQRVTMNLINQLFISI